MATRSRLADKMKAQLDLPVNGIEGACTQRPPTSTARRRRTTAAARPAPAAETLPQQPELVAPPAGLATTAALAPAPARSAVVVDPGEEQPRGAFGAWLLRQVAHRQDWIANLARAAKADPRFPKAGSVDDIRKHLSGLGAEVDMFEALDDAETAWLRS